MIRGRGSVPIGAVAALAVSCAAAAAVLLIGHQVDKLDAERRASYEAAESVTAVTDALHAAMHDAASLASSGDLGPDRQSAQAASTSTKVVARDTGHAVVDDAGFVVAAVYDTDPAPSTVADRRAHVIGYLVMPLDLQATVERLAPDQGGIAVRSPSHTLASVPSSGPGPAVSVTVPLSNEMAPGWSLTAWDAPPRIPPSAWLVAGALLAGGLGFAGWVTVRHSDSRREKEELEGLRETSATVAALATLAQQSLDLGVALPGVTSELASILELSGLSVTASSGAAEIPVFVWGTPRKDALPYHGQQELAAGQTLSFALSQGGRTVATLRVTAGRRLGSREIRTLLAACDVLAAALANAEAFSQQTQLIERMRAVDELKSTFLATASHELRTPVAAITGYASLLHSNWEQLAPEEARDFAQRLDSVAQRLARLVEEILDFSRLDAGNGAETEHSVLDLAETVGLVLDEQAELAREHHIVRVLEPGVRVRGSRHAIERVVMNLVGNAAKYSDAGSTIRVGVRGVGGRAELVVDDEGPGIPPNERGQVFAPFYRGRGDEVVRTRGAGLGLSIAAEFAASMGGEIRVEEAPSGGASFVVSYPIQAPDALADPGAAHVQA